MTALIDFQTYKRTGKIAPPRMAYSDLQNEHARKIELMFKAMEEAMRGNTKPGDTE